jgi:4-hydroxy-3-methylbut-2-enyl diphosphate reductase
LKTEWLEDVDSVAVTAGASTPTPIVKEVIDYIKEYDRENRSQPVSTVPKNKILPKIKKAKPVKIME